MIRAKKHIANEIEKVHRRMVKTGIEKGISGNKKHSELAELKRELQDVLALLKDETGERRR